MRTAFLVAVCTTLLFGSGCNKTSSAEAIPENTTSVGAGEGLNRCGLLTDTEVREALGEFHQDGQVLQNEYGLQGCRWTATTAQKVQGFTDGWFDSIEVTVFEKDREQWARHQASGVPAEGLGAGALYDDNHGQVWFACGQDRFCSLRARINNPSRRRQTAHNLAVLVRERVK